MDDEREQKLFEAWTMRMNGDVRRNEDGGYLNFEARITWLAWCAAIAQERA